MAKSKFLTTTVAAGLVTGAAAATPPDEDATDLLSQPAPGFEDVLITPDDPGDLDLPLDLQGWSDDETDFIGIDYAQTWYGGTGNDGIMTPRPGQGGGGVGVRQPEKGISLDNGIKQPGKLKLEKPAGKKKRKRDGQKRRKKKTN